VSVPDAAATLARLAERRAEREAMARALAYAAADPFYGGQPPNERERAYMMLALRAFTQPELTEGCTRALQVARQIKEEVEP
jgi:hypothetical protein